MFEFKFYFFLGKLSPKFQRNQKKRCRLCYFCFSIFWYMSSHFLNLLKNPLSQIVALYLTHNCLSEVSLCCIIILLPLALDFTEWAYELFWNSKIPIWSNGKQFCLQLLTLCYFVNNLYILLFFITSQECLKIGGDIWEETIFSNISSNL